MNEIEYLKKNNRELLTNLVIELGLLRIKDKCALCGKQIDIENYHIQLCRICRIGVLDKYNSSSDLRGKTK